MTGDVSTSWQARVLERNHTAVIVAPLTAQGVPNVTSNVARFVVVTDGVTSNQAIVEIAPPRLLGILPSDLPTNASGLVITLLGANFGNADVVIDFLSASRLTNRTATPDTMRLAFGPILSAGGGSTAFVRARNTLSPSIPVPFGPPQILDIIPRTSITTPVVSLTISGANFGGNAAVVFAQNSVSRISACLLPFLQLTACCCRCNFAQRLVTLSSSAR